MKIEMKTLIVLVLSAATSSTTLPLYAHSHCHRCNPPPPSHGGYFLGEETPRSHNPCDGHCCGGHCRDVQTTSSGVTLMDLLFAAMMSSSLSSTNSQMAKTRKGNSIASKAHTPKPKKPSIWREVPSNEDDSSHISYIGPPQTALPKVASGTKVWVEGYYIESRRGNFTETRYIPGHWEIK